MALAKLAAMGAHFVNIHTSLAGVPELVVGRG